MELKGVRVLKDGDLEEGEAYLYAEMQSETYPQDNFGIPSETPEEFYESLLQEYESEYKQYISSQPVYDFDITLKKPEDTADASIRLGTVVFDSEEKNRPVSDLRISRSDKEIFDSAHANLGIEDLIDIESFRRPLERDDGDSSGYSSEGGDDD